MFPLREWGRRRGPKIMLSLATYIVAGALVGAWGVGAGAAEANPAAVTRFAFVRPLETTVNEVVQRLGEPDSDWSSYVVENEIDVFGPPIPTPHSIGHTHRRARERGVKVIKVRVLEWHVSGRRRPVRFVFREDRLWYAMVVPGSAERTPEKLTAQYGKRPHVSTLTRAVADVIFGVRVYAYPELGVAYTQVSSNQIETKFVFPPAEFIPFGPAAE